MRFMRIIWECKEYDIRELLHVTESLNAVDELYRLSNASEILPTLKKMKKIDFRSTTLRKSKGLYIDSLKMHSPLEINVPDNLLWIAAVVYVVRKYPTFRDEVIHGVYEIRHDVNHIMNILADICDKDFLNEIGNAEYDQIQNALIGLEMVWEEVPEVRGRLKRIIESAATRVGSMRISR